ncbi:6966_t:CDS:2, partial [Dentiscutata heterogama]
NLVKKVYQSLLNYFKNPVLLEVVFRKSVQIELFLEYNVYLALPTIIVTDKKVQADKIICDYKEKNNCQ